MELEYFYCIYCGCEISNVFVAYSRTCANGDLYVCPVCKYENHVDSESEI